MEQCDCHCELISAASGETVLALPAPQKASGFEAAQSRKDGAIANTPSNRRRMRIPRDEEQQP
jgi:hypothetical protein